MTMHIFKAHATNTDYPVYAVAPDLPTAIAMLASTLIYPDGPSMFDIDSIEQITEASSHVVVSRRVVT